jgi:hypothetical protein
MLWHIKMNDQFQILINFKGFGNPKGKIWFVGLEEAANFETDIQINNDHASGIKGTDCL